MSMLDSYISKLEDALGAENVPDDLIKDTVSVFISEMPDIKSGLDRYRARAVTIGPSGVYGSNSCDNIGDARKLRDKLALYREKSTSPRLNNHTDGVTVNINNSNMNTNSATSNATVAASFSQCISYVEELCPSLLSDSDLTSLKEKLTALEESKSTEDKDRRKHRVHEIVKFTIDKGVDVLITVLPYLASCIG